MRAGGLSAGSEFHLLQPRCRDQAAEATKDGQASHDRLRPRAGDRHAARRGESSVAIRQMSEMPWLRMTALPRGSGWSWQGSTLRVHSNLGM